MKKQRAKMKGVFVYFLGLLLAVVGFGCSPQSVITVENASSLRLEKIIGSGKVNDVAWSPLGDNIVVAQDFDISFYDSISLQLIEKIGFGGKEVVFSPDGLFLAIAKDTEMIIWDIKGKVRIQEFAVDMARIDYATYNSDGAYLAVLGDSRITGGDPNSVLEVWSISSRKKVISNRETWEANIAFSPNGQILAFGSNSGLILFELATGKQQNIDLPFESGSLSYLSDTVLLKRMDYSQLRVMDLSTLETFNLINVGNGSFSDFQVSLVLQRKVRGKNG
jgi:WD40 repeat protein